MKRKKLIALYGGTLLPPQESDFVSRLSFALLDKLHCKLVTGGFRYKEREDPRIISTDESVLAGARQFAEKQNQPLEDFLETWLPETDERKEELDRFAEGKVEKLFGNDRVRRLSLVKDVDALITFSGSGQTKWVLAAAQAWEKIALPIPFSGNDSRQYWEENRDDILQSFKHSRQRLKEIADIDLRMAETDSLAEEIVEILRLTLATSEEKLLEEIREAVKNGNTREALNTLLNYCRQYRDEKDWNVSTILFGQFNSHVEAQIAGMLTQEEEKVNQARLNHRIIDFVSGLDENE